MAVRRSSMFEAVGGERRGLALHADGGPLAAADGDQADAGNLLKSSARSRVSARS
jgi:hypothetical protein